MIIGTLSKVMKLQEDSQSAYKAKIRNRAYNDPNTIIATSYNGSYHDQILQAKRMMPPKAIKQFNKKLEADKQAKIKEWQKIDRKHDVPEEEIRKFDYGKAYDNTLKVPNQVPASYHPYNKIIGVNSASPYYSYKTLTPDGNVNFNNKIVQHEKQHAIQAKIKEELARNKGKNHANKLLQNYDLEELKNKKVIQNYTTDPMSNQIHYNTSPIEFDANVAANRGYNSAGPGTIRATLQMSNQWPGRQIKPTPSHANEMQQRVEGIKYPPQTRVAIEKNLQRSLPIAYQQNYIQAPNQGKSSTTPLPQKTQEFMNKTSNKINNQIKNGRTFTNKDLENAQPLRQNPIPRKQR